MALSSMVGGAFLSATLQVLFDRLASREVLNLFSKRKSNAPGLLIKLKRKLLLLNGVLDDADVKQFTDKTVRAWSDDARDAVYQADDLLSEIAYEALRSQVEEESDPPGNLQSSTTSQVESLISGFFTSSCFDDHVELKLEDIIRSMEGLMEDSDYLGLKKVVRPVFNTSNRSSTSVVVESDVYGRDLEKEKLVNLLLSNGTKVGVVPVVGMGGMGKTTLAQLAYNDGRVGDSFEVKAWACVAEEFDIFKISKTILESVTKSHCTSTDLNRVQESLKEELKAKKYLIVLDDVWNKSYREWDRLRAPFRTGAPGSKIIVTTRIQGAADIMTTGPVINLAELSDDKSWSLFAKIAFDEKDPSSFPLLEEIGRKIVARCKGLPLAVKSLAGLLRSKHQVEEWNDILRSEFWDLPEDTSDILPALRLSYHYLPSHLKQCFAFCSVFSKNYSFDRDDIVSMWIAQRFVLVQGGKSYGIEGRKYFHELLSMSFFQPHGISKSRFVMHDLIHDLAQVVSGQFSFRLDDENPRDISIRARHFSICTRSVTGFQQLRGATEVNGLRSFLVTRIPEQVCLVEVLSRQKHLRLLSLRCYGRINEVLDIVGSLIHLHYLDLSKTPIEKLPEAICRLYNLETLLLVGCPHLTTLPTGIGRLCSLRRLDVTDTNLVEMPLQMSQLKGLEYLPTFVVGKRGGGLCIDGLKAFSSLRGLLKILGLENVRDIKKGSEAMLREKQHLETLHLEWGTTSVNRSQNGRRLLNYLRPHTNLKQLKITRFGGKRFPDWLGHRWYAQMVSLSLEECNNCLFLPPLGQLPSLKKLTVKGMAGVIEVGEEFYGSCAGTYQPFPSLESLKFEDMYNWVKWHIPGVGEFPKLRQLKMIDCTKIVGGIPDINFHSMVIRRCSRLEVLVPTVSSSNVVTDAGKELVVHRSKGVDLNWQFMCGLVKLYLSDLPSLQVLTTELYTLTILKDLEIRECPNLVSLSNMSLPPMLSGLVISHCDRLQSVVDGPVLFCTLQRLTIRDCPSLVRFAVNGLPSSLSKVEFWNCPQLEFPLPEYTDSCYSVDELGLRACPSLEPTMLQKLFPNLQRLKIFSDDSVTSFLNGQRACNDQQGLLANLTSITMRDCESLKSIPEGLFDLLPSLRLQNCPEMESFGEAGLPSSLVELNIIRCEKLVSFRSGWGLHRLPCLRNLNISGADEFVESFPEEGLLPSTLTKLELVSFPNWKALNWKGFQHLISLRDLTIWKCPQLQSFPDEELPPFIITLRIGECPLLTPRCQKDIGADWPKIAHIPNIILDNDVISSSEGSAQITSLSQAISYSIPFSQYQLN